MQLPEEEIISGGERFRRLHEQLTMLEYEANRLKLQADLSAPGIVIFSEIYYPVGRRGWTAGPRGTCSLSTQLFEASSSRRAGMRSSWSIGLTVLPKARSFPWWVGDPHRLGERSLGSRSPRKGGVRWTRGTRRLGLRALLELSQPSSNRVAYSVWAVSLAPWVLG